jgi:hypothetical protein
MTRFFDRPPGRAARLLPASAAALLLLLAAACSGLSERTLRAMVPDAEDQYAQSRLQLLASGNTAAFARELAPDLQGPASDEQLQEMARVFAGRPIQRFQLIGVQVGTADGVTRRNLSYQLRLADGWAVANVQSRTVDGQRVIEGATVTRIAEPLDRTHAFRLAGKPSLSYAILAAAVVIPLLMLYAAILAFRMPVRHRWLWVLLSLVAFGRWDLNWTTGETRFLPVNLQLLGSGIVRPSAFAPWIITIAFPAGALWVIWRYHRGRWRTAPQPPAPETETETETAAGDPEVASVEMPAGP